LRLGEFSNLVLCLIPVFLIALSSDLLRACHVGLSDLQLSVAATSVAVTTVLLLLPTIGGKWVGVQKIDDGRMLERIECLRKGARIRWLDAVMVPSNGRWYGAAVIGWFPGFRKLWLGDALLERLDGRQLDMVILHELAHVRRRHVYWRSLPIIWTVGLVAIYVFFSELLPPDALPFWLGRGLCLALASVTLLIGIGQVSRSCELDADREACHLARNACEWAKQQPEEPERVLAQALQNILDTPEAARRTWLHPSLRERLGSLAENLTTFKGAPRAMPVRCR
jgi:Zn-dependent protease with chaperone function